MSRFLRRPTAVVTALLLVSFLVLRLAAPANAQTAPVPTVPTVPAGVPSADGTGTGTGTGTGGDQKIQIDLGGTEGRPSQSVLIILGLTVLALAVAPHHVDELHAHRDRADAHAQRPRPAGCATQPGTHRVGTLPQPLRDEPHPLADEQGRPSALPGREDHADAGMGQRERTAQGVHAEERAVLELKLMTDAARRRPGDRATSTSTLIRVHPLGAQTAFIIGFVVFVHFIVIGLVVSSCDVTRDDAAHHDRCRWCCSS
jgi:flagellar biosynthetic protein FliP